MKVAILTNFTQRDECYSLNNVVETQISMLISGGYTPRVIVCEGFRPAGMYAHPDVDLAFIPNVPRSNNPRPPKEEHVAQVEAALRPALEGVKAVLTHDLIYQPASLPENFAARRIAEDRPDMVWLHWVHSATAPSILQRDYPQLKHIKRVFPHSLLVYPNEYEHPRLSRNFGYAEDRIVCVPHVTDPAAFLDWHPLTRELFSNGAFLGAEVIGVYPCRLDRGKQVEVCIKIFAEIKRLGRSCRLLVMDFHSTGGDKVVYREELGSLARRMGVGEEVLFTSQLHPDLHVGCPRQMVRDLMLVADVFILPSRSETYSLVAQEAALCGNLLVLNFDFPPIRSVYGEKAIYRKFSSNIDAMTGNDGETRTEYANEGAYMREVAGRILYELSTNLTLAQRNRIRRTRNPHAVFRDYLEPLLYAEVP